ncbi:hypothetical protein [Ornithinimicrobium kibberense]|uniref:hypothetical protein n=1 Tax=Ornithinimicrobium kibberense TaxID=282060 RepID=UPI00360D4534
MPSLILSSRSRTVMNCLIMGPPYELGRRRRSQSGRLAPTSAFLAARDRRQSRARNAVSCRPAPRARYAAR